MYIYMHTMAKTIMISNVLYEELKNAKKDKSFSETIKDLMDECGPLIKEPRRVVLGGPMMGIAQYSLMVPVVKSTNGIIFLSEAEIEKAESAFCIRCSRCVESCPLGLLPCMIAMAVEKGRWDLAKAYGALECMECGACNYTCPQRRNIVQAVKQAKSHFRK